jgi:uncharacterized membrane protein YkoI
MNARRALLLILWLVVLGAGAEAVRAAPAQGTGRVPVAGGAVSMDQAVKMVETRFRARVVKAETENDNGRVVYVLRLLSDSGKVWTVHVDAASGSLQ